MDRHVDKQTSVSLAVIFKIYFIILKLKNKNFVWLSVYAYVHLFIP